MLCWITVTSLLLNWGIWQHINTSDNIRCDNASEIHVSLHQSAGRLCKFAHLICLMCECVHVLTATNLLSLFLRARNCHVLQFPHCKCWVSRSSYKTVRLYCHHYFCQAFFCLPFQCVPLHNSPLGQLGPWGSVCPLAADSSANILEFSSPGEHWPLPGRQTETGQSSFYFIYSTHWWWTFKRNALTHSGSHTDNGWTDEFEYRHVDERLET